MKHKDKIYEDIKNEFKVLSNIGISNGSVIDLYTLATSSALEEVYQTIEDNKNPHIFTKLSGQELDDMGVMVNCPREIGEDDKTYKYRIMNWTLSNEAGNKTAIENSILNLEYASSAKHIPFTEGVGTATIYIIPKKYDDDIINKAVEEVRKCVSNKISKTSYTTYVVPKPKLVDIVAHVSCEDMNTEQLQYDIHQQLKDYINSIAPNEYLELGTIQKQILLNDKINYFNILELYIDNKIQHDKKLYQPITEKFLLNSISLVNE